MQSSQWTPDRLRDRIRDHLRWEAAVGAEGNAPPARKWPFRTRPWSKKAVRECVSGIPFVGPGLWKLLRKLKPGLRRTLSPWL